MLLRLQQFKGEGVSLCCDPTAIFDSEPIHREGVSQAIFVVAMVG